MTGQLDKWTAIACGLIPIIIMAVSLMVIVGWVIENEWMVSVIRGSVPMQFNAAVCFLLTSMAMIWLAKDVHMSTAFIIPVGIIGFMTTLEYSTDVRSGIDTLFISPFIVEETPNPGQMAPTTALSFLITYMAVFAHTARKFFNFCVVAIFMLGALPFFGYLIGLPALYRPSEEVTSMAVHTAFCFMLVGSGLYCCKVDKLSLIPTYIVDTTARALRWVKL